MAMGDNEEDFGLAYAWWPTISNCICESLGQANSNMVEGRMTPAPAGWIPPVAQARLHCGALLGASGCRILEMNVPFTNGNRASSVVLILE